MWLLSLFIGATVFGAGVTLVDMIGGLGDGDGDSDSDSDGADDGDFGDGDDGGEEGSVAGHDAKRRGNPFMAFLSAMRNVVYFCLGFGPVGWFATATNMPLLETLAWSGAGGVVVLVLVRLLRGVLRQELNSEIKDSDLLMETGEVTVSIQPGAMGKVRLTVGGSYVDRFAKSRDEEALVPGTKIRVTDIDDDSIVVEKERSS